MATVVRVIDDLDSLIHTIWTWDQECSLQFLLSRIEEKSSIFAIVGLNHLSKASVFFFFLTVRQDLFFTSREVKFYTWNKEAKVLRNLFLP